MCEANENWLILEISKNQLKNQAKVRTEKTQESRGFTL